MDPQTLYGYTLQYTSIDNYKPKDILFQGDLYVDPHNFIEFVTEFMEETLADYRNDDGNYQDSHVYEPLTMERLECLAGGDYAYIFYEKNHYSFTYVAVKHEIIH